MNHEISKHLCHVVAKTKSSQDGETLVSLSEIYFESYGLMVLETLLITPTERRQTTVTRRVLEARFSKGDKVESFSTALPRD